MQAGKLRWPITIQTLTTAPNSYGEAVPTPETFANTWAEVTQLSGRELWYAQQVQPLATHRVRCRYVAGVTPAMQVVFQGRTLQLTDVNDVDGRHRELVMLATEKK